MGHSAESAFAPDLLKCSMVHSAGSGPVLRAMARSKLWITYIFYSVCSCGNVSIASSCVSTCRWPSIHVILYPWACDSGYTSQNFFYEQCATVQNIVTHYWPTQNLVMCYVPMWKVYALWASVQNLVMRCAPVRRAIKTAHNHTNFSLKVPHP